MAADALETQAAEAPASAMLTTLSRHVPILASAEK